MGEYPVYTVDYFIEKFSKIPEKEWCVNYYYIFEGTYPEKRCALGHCGEHKMVVSPEAESLRNLFMQNLVISVDRVNDSSCDGVFPQETPKARILAALEVIKNRVQS